MRIPGFIKEVVWTFYPPRYRQLADKSFFSSLWYMSRILLLAFLISGIIIFPKLFSLKSSFESEFTKFEQLDFNANISQSAPIIIPASKPWVVIDLNSRLNLTSEFFVVDNETIKYRFLGITTVSHEEADGKGIGQLSVVMFSLMLPGIAILLYARSWLKYFLLVFVIAIVFFIIMELSRLRLRWKQMLNIAAHAITPIIILESVSAPITTVYLIPVLKFLGLRIYAVSLVVLAFFMIVGIIGYHFEERRK